MLGIRFSWHGRDGCLEEMSRNAMNIYIVHLIFRERGRLRLSRTFFLLLPPMLSQTGIFGHAQYRSQSKSMALFCSITCVSQQLWQYLGFGKFGISSGLTQISAAWGTPLFAFCYQLCLPFLGNPQDLL